MTAKAFLLITRVGADVHMNISWSISTELVSQLCSILLTSKASVIFKGGLIFTPYNFQYFSVAKLDTAGCVSS